jgi:serine phosphatase RsbU (regulator of sigma subunit)/anti-sigma regulatory factor (Ser/Thr protein kinase)
MAENTGATQAAILRIALVCDLKQVRPAAQMVQRFLADHGCDEETLTACNLALVEGCNNAIQYAPESARARPVLVEAICNPGQIELRVTDHTSGFNWPKRVELPEAESESGRGLYLIQSLMDSANYLRSPGENVLILRKGHPMGGMARVMEFAECKRKLAEEEAVVQKLVEEISSCYESLSAIFRYSAEHSKITNLKEFARRLLTDLLHITGADWFVFRTLPPGESRLVVLVASEPALVFEPLDIPVAAQTAGPVELETANSRRPVWFDDLRSLSPFDPLRGVKFNSCGLAHPVFAGDNLIGTLAIGKKTGDQTPAPGQANLVFTAGQTNVVGTFTHFLAIQIVNARYQDEMLANQLVAREVEIASRIQQSLLIKRLPQLSGFDLAAFCQSAHQVGGDFYDVLKIGDHAALLAIADVMGKGVLAAMFAAILRTVLRAAPELTHQPAGLLTRVNQLLFEELSGVEMFITAQLAYLDAKERKLTVASAGHCPLLLAQGGVPGVKTFSPEGLPLGVLPDTLFSDEVVALPGPCRVLLYTDGLTEAPNVAGERYGQPRLMDWLEEAAKRTRTAEQLKRELADTLGKFQANTVLNDDQTFLIIMGE